MAAVSFIAIADSQAARASEEAPDGYERILNEFVGRLRFAELELRKRFYKAEGVEMSAVDLREAPRAISFQVGLTFPDMAQSAHLPTDCEEIRRLVTVPRPLTPEFAARWGRAKAAKSTALWQITAEAAFSLEQRRHAARMQLIYWSNLTLTASGSITLRN